MSTRQRLWHLRKWVADFPIGNAIHLWTGEVGDPEHKFYCHCGAVMVDLPPYRNPPMRASWWFVHLNQWFSLFPYRSAHFFIHSTEGGAWDCGCGAKHPTELSLGRFI